MSEPVSLKIYEKSDKEPFPDLRNLLDGWFHQDFDIEGPDLETILPRYVDASWRVDVQGAIQDVNRFIDLYGEDDVSLREAVERILKPEVIIEGWDGMTTRQWLLHVAELLESALRSKRATEQQAGD